MTRKYYTTGNYKSDHSTFGGEIDIKDFGGHVSMSTMAKRIISGWKFDEDCKNNAEK